MIIVQTPLRISFFGGGTDFPSFFMDEGGCVLSSAIDKYIFVTVKERFDKKLRIGYTQTEMVDDLESIQASELKYLDSYDRHPLLTDFRYFFKSWWNILFRHARSR